LEDQRIVKVLRMWTHYDLELWDGILELCDCAISAASNVLA
jgi:hypothetical protein